MAGLSAWVQAFRLRTLPLATACVILGSFLPETAEDRSIVVFVLTLLTAILLQILSNLANDYGDFKKGTDNADRLGPVRMMQSGAINEKEMKSMLIQFVILSLISGLCLLYLAFGREDFINALIMFTVGLAAIWAAIRYTLGNKPYGYAGLGDVFVILFFGFVGVGGTAFLQIHEINVAVLMISMSYGLLAAGVLNINNLRDIDNDKASGKYTLAARLGRKQAAWYQFTLVVFSFLFSLWYLNLNEQSALKYLSLIGYIPVAVNAYLVWQRRKNPHGLNPLLKGLSLSILFEVLLFVIVLNLLD